MAAGLEPAFTPGRPIWPFAGRALADLEPDDPDLAIPHGALQQGVREAPERLFHARHDGLITHKPTDPLAPKPARRDLHRKWKLALIASCFFHAAVALFFIQAADDAAKIEGAEYSGEAMLGNASEEQVSAGETANVDGAVEVTMITMLEAKPVETIEAEAVPVEESVQAVETVEPTAAEVETLEPVEETSSQPADVAQAEKVDAAPAEQSKAEQAEPVEPDAEAQAATSEKAPEVLATERLAEESDAVQRPSKATETEQATTVETVQPTAPEKTVQAEPEPEPKPVAKAEKEPARKKAEAKEKPAEEKTARKQEAKPNAEKDKKVAEKAAPSKRATAGNRGQNKADTRRGQANGAAGSQASSKGGKASAAGNAAVSNYPGKVAAKLRRSLRYPAEAKRKRLRGTVQVAFVVSASGGVGSIHVVSSSGSPILDKAALETVRRAAPFPKIPAAAGRSSWPFSVPLAFSR